MAVKWIFLWMGPGLSKAEVIHCLVRGRRTPENRPRCLLQRGQGNFKLAANFGYSSRGSADPRESLRKRRILKLALTAHLQDLPPTGPATGSSLRMQCNKVLPLPDVADRFRILIFTWGGVVESDCGWKEKHKKKITGYGAGERIRGVFTYKNGNRTC